LRAFPGTIERGPALLYNLHLLRVIAALSVVYFHTTSVAGLNLPYDVGSRGVDVFFVISGFIIAYIGTSKPEQFLRRRLIRVVPFYWAATLCVFAMVALAPSFFHSTTASVPHLLYSLLFIPHMSVAGEMHPTLVLGWSLNFEMFFYVAFAAALALGPRRAPLACVAWLVAFVVAIHAIHVRSDVLEFYARPIVLEFCFGIGVFYVFNWCSERRDRLARIGALKAFLVVLLVGGLVVLNLFEKMYPETPRYLAAGIPAVAIVTSALLLERIFGLATRNRVIYLLGEASYIIYLVHPYIVFAVLRVAVKGRTLAPPVTVALIVGLLALVSGIAIAVHVLFEKPVMAFLRDRLTPPRKQPAVSAESGTGGRLAAG
jgi:exopolysaccharide production protein ExoZ